MELCAGCEALAKTHPYVGVGRDHEGFFDALPICEVCWRDPAHRKVTLKMHFFPRAQAEQALDAAERNIMVEKR